MKHKRRYSGQKKRRYFQEPAAKINGQWVRLSDMAHFGKEVWEATRLGQKPGSDSASNSK